MFVDKRSIRVLIITAILFIAFSVTVFLCRVTGDIQTRLITWYSDKQLVAWVGVLANFAVVGVALFLNLLLESFRRSRFRVTCRDTQPWQVTINAEAENVQLLFVRLQVQNIGRTYEEACEVRIEQVLRLFSNKDRQPEPLEDLVPRPLKWIERDTSSISLNTGTFDFVDLGVRRSDSLDLFRLDFPNRPHLDLWLDDTTIGFRVAGAVYGKRAKPQSFTFDLFWNSFEFGPIKVKG
jgi:hypothetical protein